MVDVWSWAAVPGQGTPVAAARLRLRVASRLRCCAANGTSSSFSPATMNAGFGVAFGITVRWKMDDDGARAAKRSARAVQSV